VTRRHPFHPFPSRFHVSSRPRHASSRGQLSLEYISVYAFATLTLLLTLGALSYFGLFSVDSFRSQSCTFAQGIACRDYVLGPVDPGTGVAPYLRFDIGNGYGVNVTVTAARVSIEQVPAGVPCLTPTPLNADGSWGDGNATTLWCGPIPAGAYVPGDFYDGSVRVNFTQVGGGYVHSVGGRFSIRAQ
jgi:hypothetical protein